MEISNKLVKGIMVITIKGSIDALTAPEITAHINGLIADDNHELVIDFGGVDYTSSAGLRVLLSVVKATRSKGGDLYLVDIQPDVEMVLNLSGFTNILNIYPDVDSAVKDFS